MSLFRLNEDEVCLVDAFRNLTEDERLIVLITVLERVNKRLRVAAAPPAANSSVGGPP
jgi:hypothetical protein